MKKLEAILETDWKGFKDYVVAQAKTNHLNKTFETHYSNFNGDERKHLIDYTESSNNLNGYLWDNHPRKDYENSFHDEKINHLDSAMTRHKTPHKLTVFSGTKFDPRNHMDENKIVHHPAYLSTSLSKKTAASFGTTNYHVDENGRVESEKHVLKIHVPKNHPGAYVDHFSDNKGEKEFILPRGTKLKYKYTDTHKIQDEKDNHNIHEHHMEIVK